MQKGLHLIMQLLNSTWYSHQYTDLWYSHQCMDLQYSHQCMDLWYSHQCMDIWYSHQCMDLWYSHQCMDLWYSHQCMDLWYNHQYMVHLTQCVPHLAMIHCRGWDTHYSKTQCRLSLSASSQATSPPTRTSTLNNLRHRMTCASSIRNGGNSGLLLQQHLKASLAMLTTTASLSVFGCGTQISLLVAFKYMYLLR